MIVENGKFYIYRHVTIINPHVFYIGRGTKRKYSTKRSMYARAYYKERTQHWKNKVNKYGYKIEILLETNDIEFLYKKEKYFIKLYGREILKEGTLINIQEGGKGRQFYTPSIKTINKIKKSLKGRKMSEDFRKLSSDRMKGNCYRKGYRHTDEVYKRMAEKKKVRIYMYNYEGKFIKYFDSVKETAKYISVSPATIHQCLNKKQKQSKGYRFSYIMEKLNNIEYKIYRDCAITSINIITKEVLLHKTPSDASKLLNISTRKIYHSLYGDTKIVANLYKFKRTVNE